MQLEKATPHGALVKHEPASHKIALGLGVAGTLLLLPFGIHWIALAAGIGAMWLSWESAMSRDRRSLIATAAFGLGAIPIGFLAVGAAIGLLKIAILLALVGGAIVGGRAMVRSRSRRRLDR